MTPRAWVVVVAYLAGCIHAPTVQHGPPPQDPARQVEEYECLVVCAPYVPEVQDVAGVPVCTCDSTRIIPSLVPTPHGDA